MIVIPKSYLTNQKFNLIIKTGDKMIRLLAIRRVMEQVSAEEATMMCCGNTSYIELCKLLPWIFPKSDWRDLVQAQLLSGIKPRELNSRLSEPLTNTQIHRIKRHGVFPEAEYIKAGTLNTDLIITVAKEFYYNVLKPLQFSDYVEPPNDYIKWWLIKSKARGSVLVNMYIHNERILKMLKLMQSHPAGRKGEVFYEMPATSTLCRMLDTTHSNVSKFDKVYDEPGHKAAKEYSKELNEVWDLLYRIRTIGIINDNLMEATYEDFFRT